MKKLNCFLRVIVVLKEACGEGGGAATDVLRAALILAELFSLPGRERLVEMIQVNSVIETVPLCFVDEMHFADCPGNVASLFEKMSDGPGCRGQRVFQDFRPMRMRIRSGDDRSA